MGADVFQGSSVKMYLSNVAFIWRNFLGKKKKEIASEIRKNWTSPFGEDER